MDTEIQNSSYEQKFGSSKRFGSMSDLYSRYVLVRDQTEEFRTKWKNHMLAYRRYPYKRKDGGVDANFGQFRFKIDQAVGSFKSIIMEREYWARLIPKNAPDAATRTDWEHKMSKCWHESFIRPWVEGIIQTHWDIFNMQMCMAGVAHFQNKGDVYPESLATEMLFPDLGSSVLPSKWNICFILKRMTLTELYEKSKREVDGWDKSAIYQLLDDKGNEAKDVLTPMERLRIGTEGQQDTGQSLLVVIAYVKEYKKDGEKGKVTKYVFPESGYLSQKAKDGGVKETRYLQKVENYCECISEVVSIRTFHSFKEYWSGEGLAHSIYLACMQYDQTMNRAIRASLRKASMYFNSNNPDEQEKLRKMPDAEVIVLDPDTKIAQVTVSTELADLATTTKQLMFDTERGTGEALGMGSQNVRNRAITAEEQRANVMKETEQEGTELDIFILQDTYLVREMVRRSLKVTDTEDEYDGLKAFKIKMDAYGIPEDAYKFDNMLVESSYTIVGGSMSGRLQLIDKLIGYTRIKPEHSGVENAVREGIGALVGYDSVDHYWPYGQKPDESEVQRAGTENEILDDPELNPINVQVLATHNHPAHCEMHLADAENDLEIAKVTVEQFKQVPFVAQPVSLEKTHVKLRSVDNKLSHIEAHLQFLVIDPYMEGYVKAAKQRISRIRNIQQDLMSLHQNNIETFAKDNQQNAFLTQEQQLKIADMQRQLEFAKAMDNIKLGTAVEKAELGAVRANQAMAENEAQFQQGLQQDRTQAAVDLQAKIEKESVALAASQQKATQNDSKNKK